MKLYSMLGVTFNALTIDELNKLIEKKILKGEKSIIANHNLHSLYIFHHNSEMRDFYKKASYIHLDGMSIVFLARLFGLDIKRKHRVTYVDWIRPLMGIAEKNGWRVFFLGSKPGVGEKAKEVLKKEFPNLEISVYHGYFNKTSNENEVIKEMINSFKPNILLVGMGMPIQEKWIKDNYNHIDSNIFLPCGACMDYVSGEISTPPRWMGRIGLEWLYRLMSDPKRLWKRYLIEPFFILKLILKYKFKRGV